MKVTIDLAQSPKQLETELTQVVRLTLGPNYFIESNEETPQPQTVAQQQGLPVNVGVTEQPNFSPNELASPVINLPGAASPVLQAVNAGSTPGAAELDSAGNPWDPEIHSGGKSKIANGTWKLKKGVSPDLVQQVLARNKSYLSSPLPGSNPPPTTQGLPALPTTAGLPDLPPLTPEPVKQLPEAEVVVTDYASFAEWIAQQAAKPGLAEAVKANLDHGLKHYGFVDDKGNPHLPAVAHRPDAIDGFHRWLKFQVLGQQ